jgi:hypothetical protein
MTINRLNQDVTYLPAFRNLIINGAMQVAQRGTSTTSITASGYHTADRWSGFLNNLGTWTQSVENDAPTGSGFRNSLKVLCTTADATPAAGDRFEIRQQIEGQNLQSIRKGTASAQQLTASFWVKSNVTGTYIAEIFDIDNTRQVSAAYTINASATWEKKTITFPADTTGAFDNDNNSSGLLNFWLGAGTNFTSGTLGTTWASSTSANRAVGQTNLAAATNNYWQVTGVQLEVGAVATPFEFKPIDAELAQCQRYYTQLNSNQVSLGYCQPFNTTNAICSVPVPVTMRSGVATVSLDLLLTKHGTNSQTVTSLTGGSFSGNQVQFTATVASGLTGGELRILEGANASAFLGFSAEL